MVKLTFSRSNNRHLQQQVFNHSSELSVRRARNVKWLIHFIPAAAATVIFAGGAHGATIIFESLSNTLDAEINGQSGTVYDAPALTTEGNNNFYNVTSPIASTTSSCSQIDYYGDAGNAVAGPFYSAIGSDYFNGSGTMNSNVSSSAIAQNQTSAPPIISARTSATTSIVFQVTEPCLATVITPSNEISLGPESGSVGLQYGFYGYSAAIPGNTYSFYFTSVANSSVDARSQSQSEFNLNYYFITLTPFASVPSGQNQSASVLVGSGGIHQVTATVASTGGGTLTGRFHAVDLSSYSDSDQMMGASAPTFTLPSSQLLLWNMGYGPSNRSESDVISMNFQFAASDLLAGADYNLLEMYQFQNGSWVAVPTAINASANTATIVTSSPSLFALGSIQNVNSYAILRGGSLATLTADVRSGYASGTWNGSGISSSSAAADSTHLTALGTIQNSVDGTTTGTALYTTFEGQSVNDSDVLIKYTYYGDANLDGKMDGSDYSRIDNGYLNHLTGWFNGDFNYDGIIDGSDYTLIDNAYNSQGAQLTTAVATTTDQIQDIGAESAVPEPASFGMLAAAAVLLGRRRRGR